MTDWPGGAPRLWGAALLSYNQRRDDAMGMAVPIYYTAEQVRALPDDGNRYEVVHGELLVTPSPRLLHQEIVRRLLVQLSLYLESEPVGHVLQAPADISWGTDTLVQPDVFVAPVEQVGTLEWSRVTSLLLVAEVLSPSSSRADRFTKRIEYQRQRIPLYWALDADQRQVEVWRPEDTVPRLERKRLVWHPVGAVRPFEAELEALFRPITGR
jgi:Uma2 family endonuclease